MLILPRDMVEQLRGYARSADPAECCGLMIGRTEGMGRVVHRLDPIDNDAPDGYQVQSARFAAAESAARTIGAYVCGVYHSHPRGPARPSRRDGELAWPGLDYVIVGCDGAVRAWRLSDDRRFMETRVEVGAP